MLREQNAIMARIVHEQQLLICDLNEKLLLKLEGDKQLELEEEMAIENDIFGIEPVYFGEYQTGSDFWILNVSVEEAQMSRDLDCLKKLKVTQPEVRDRIVQIARNSTGEEGPVLVLMHRKK